jgi:broad specificity phosphatase PhoE
VIVSLVRHAKAGSRSTWSASDADRPLDPKGWAQADAIADLLGTRDLARLVSSPALRCRQTLAPLVHRLGLPLEIDPALAEGSAVGQVLALLSRCIADDHDVVLCSHGDVIPAILDALVGSGVTLPTPRHCQKGSVWDLHVDDGRIVEGRYITTA